MGSEMCIRDSFETTRHTNRLIDVIVESHEGRFCPTLSYPHFARPIREGAKRALSRSARPGSRVRARWPARPHRASWTGGSRRCSGRGPRGRRFRMVRADVIVSSRADAVAFTPRAGRRARRASAPARRRRSRRARRESRARGGDVATRRSRSPRRRRARRPRAPLERATSLFPSPQPPTADRSKR